MCPKFRSVYKIDLWYKSVFATPNVYFTTMAVGQDILMMGPVVDKSRTKTCCMVRDYTSLPKKNLELTGSDRCEVGFWSSRQCCQVSGQCQGLKSFHKLQGL